MRMTFFILLTFVCISLLQWHYDLDEAKQIAHKEHKYILLNFSGSDWCGPCIRMKTVIFEAPVFKEMADTQLVLVNADFPRTKKHQLSAAQQVRNNTIADKYNPTGRFPFTVLLDAYGKVLKEWDGFKNETAADFTLEVRNSIYSNSKRSNE